MSNLKAMRACVEVAARGSFASAAREIGMSTSSVSRLVQELEDWLGCALFRRTTRHLTLTDTGEQYLKRCQDIVAATDDLYRDSKAASGLPRGQLNIAAAAYPMRKLVAPLVPSFLANYPEIRLSFQLQDKPIHLVEEGIDLAIRAGTLPDSAMIARKCTDVRICLTASPKFLSDNGRPKNLDELPLFPCLVDTVPDHKHRWPIGRRVNVHGPVTANDGEVIREMTLAGLGISLLPDFFVQDDIESGNLIELFPEELDDTLGVYALFPNRKSITPSARAFVDFMVENMGKKKR